MSLFPYLAPDIARPTPEDLMESLLVKMEQTGVKDIAVLRALGVEPLLRREGGRKGSSIVDLPASRVHEAILYVVKGSLRMT